jgi:hypothetical protein
MPELVPADDPPELSLVDQYPDEMRRWTVWFGVPMLCACAFIMLAIGTSASWLYGGVVLFGPGLGVGAIMYLAMSSDTNGRAHIAAGSSQRSANDEAAPRRGR